MLVLQGDRTRGMVSLQCWLELQAGPAGGEAGSGQGWEGRPEQHHDLLCAKPGSENLLEGKEPPLKDSRQDRGLDRAKRALRRV